MDWFGNHINNMLAIVRAVHFAATSIVVGSLIFRLLIVEPSWDSPQAVAVGKQTGRVAAIGLVVVMASGAIWLLLQAAAMSGLPFNEAVTADVLSTVVTGTQFGLAQDVRFALAIILAGCLSYDDLAPSRWLGLLSALGLVAAIAWTGHAGAGIGEMGALHLAADVLHLIGAAAWLGGLVSLVLLFGVVRRDGYASMLLARDAIRRFSTLGIACVGTLILTGIINAWMLVGSLHALLFSDYGRLLTLKLGLFAVMLSFAAANRFWWTPRLVLSSGRQPQLNSLRQLSRNSIIEIVLGIIILGIVGVLGTQHPAIHALQNLQQ
jgi:putative copper resistance protein D